jgi:hypothetical protein
MDEVTTRAYIREHAEAVERGDMAAVAEDFSRDLRPQVAQIVQALPLPVKKAEVVEVEVGDVVSVAVIRYSGEQGAVKIRSNWQDDRDEGRPVIVSAEPAD